MGRRLEQLMLFWIAVTAMVVGGCVPSGIYTPDGRTSPAAAISKRSQWNVFGDLREPHLAADGLVRTAAVSGNPYDGAMLTIDLGKACLFNMVVIDHGADEYGFPRRLDLLTSMDGQSFRHRWSGPGMRRVTNICPFTPIFARYIRFRVTIPGDRPWSVAEVYVQ